jgi:hypothetical protein
MLKVIDDEKLIRKYAKVFVREFKPFADETIKVKLGHQGASFPARVRWSEKLGIWFFSQTVKGVRYWNAFGTDRPGKDSRLAITVEINFPRAGIDRRTGAAFASDTDGRVYAIHRGIIGGGKKGIGKSLFWDHYRGVWARMEDGRAPALVAVIGALGSPRFALQAALFVRKIGKLKAMASFSVQTSLRFPEITFREELIGRSPSPTSGHIAEACDHGLIVGRLAQMLEERGYKAGNDKNRELYLGTPDGRGPAYVLAVASDSSEGGILSAAAGLLIRKASEGEDARAVIVLPEQLMNKYARPLERIGVGVLSFRLEPDGVVFPDLNKIRLDQNQRI